MMDNTDGLDFQKNKMKDHDEVLSEEEEEDEMLDSEDNEEDDDDTIARIRRAHFAQTAAMSKRRRAPARPRAMSQKRKLEAVKNFHDFTKKLKKDTGITIRSLVGKNFLDLSDFTSEEDSKSDSDGLSEEEFVVNPSAVEELEEENESYIDPETGDFVEKKKSTQKPADPPPQPIIEPEPQSEQKEELKTLSISDIIDEGDFDLTKNVEIAEVEGSELCPEKTAEELLGMKQEENSEDYDITEKLKDMGEIIVKPIKKDECEQSENSNNVEKKPEGDDEKKGTNTNALNVRRNIREVMDEKQLDASTLTAQRQESERLARVQEQQRIIREVQRQIAINRQNKVHQKTLQLLQGGSSLLKKGLPGNKLNLPNTVLVKLQSGEMKRTTLKHGQVEVTRVPKPTTSGAALAQKLMKSDQKTEKKEVVEIVDSSSGEETSSSSSDSDDCIMLSDSEVPPSPEPDEDPNNSGLHVNDTYNIPDEQGRVQINIGHPENEEDIFLAPQIARIIKPHQIGGVRFLFDNIIESVERFTSSTGFGCILAHSMGLGKTLQIVCFCDIFLRHTKSKTVLCIMPINTLQNWVAEFNKWLPLDATNNPLAAQGEVRPRNFPIYVLNDSHKTLQMRAKVVKDWTTTGGVLMIGYELYRLLSMKKDKKPRKKRKTDAKQEDKDDKKSDKPELGNDDTQGSDITSQSKHSEELKEKEDDSNKADDLKDDTKKEDTPTDEDKKLLDEMYEALVKPGPDLVICDEGHRIKNSHSNISYALKQMRTKRRVVLTGYPLQNNLLEYWCMVDFVRPNYLGSKTEFCNMFERPIQNGQCIDSTPQDIRLMRYRAHVLHSLLVGFVQRRSHAVLQSTLPQKEEFVLLIRLTALQRKLYDQFMNEVVRSTSVPNPLKAFAICCKIWNHPDVLYNFLKKRSEANAAIEEDLDLEELGGVTKAGRATRSKATTKRATKPRGAKGAAKKPAATIPPNTSSSGPPKPHTGEPNNSFGNAPYPPNGPPYGPPAPYTADQPEGSYPPYSNFQNQGSGYYPPNQGYNQNYGNNYYQQPPYGQQPPYPNQYPQNNTDQQYNQNYWPNGNYYGNSGYYNNPQYPQNNQPPQDYRGTQPPDYNNPQQYPPNYVPTPADQSYSGNSVQPYQNNQEGYGPQEQPPYTQGSYQSSQSYPGYNANAGPGPSYPPQPDQTYPNQNYPSSYAGNSSYPNPPVGPYNTQFGPRPAYPGYPNGPPNQLPTNMPEQAAIKNEPAGYVNNAPKTEPNSTTPNSSNIPYENPAFNYNQNISTYSNTADTGTNGNYSNPYGGYPANLETKSPLGSSDSPVTAWPIPSTIKTEVDRIKTEERAEIKSESDGEVKIEDLDTKKIVKDESKKDIKNEVESKLKPVEDVKKDSNKPRDSAKTDSASEQEEVIKKGKQKGKGKESKKTEKRSPRGKGKPKGRKDRKTSKEKNDDSESEESEKEEKLNREEELALVKKAEEMTYDWATELLKDYVPGIIENSAKMELFFYILNESIKLGDRLLLFSQSLFTLNLIEDFLEKNYIPGTNCLWQRNTNYYRLDGSTHALEREKLINEFNANPNVYLFLVSTRAGSLGINLVGANRVIVFDASWNPCHDTQAVCRVYRYGQQKPCFVYRFVMDWCLEKKIYDRQINKQGMADRVVDECNPDAVLSMKEITNLCFDNDEKESDPKDLSEYKDKYLDVIMQGIIMQLGKHLSKEPFQHESLLVDRKEKKLSSAEKRLAQRGYELEKKAAAAPKPTTAYRSVRAADGSVVQRPVASVRPMQHGARWIPADVWRRQGMTAQEMTLPLDVVIPTNSAEKSNIVLKAGQRVMVLKSPKGIYMQLESGKIIAIKTSLKGLGQKAGDSKDGVGKKILGPRPSASIPGSLKNNSAITITSKTGPKPGLQRVITRPFMGQNKIVRPLIPGHRPDIRSRVAYPARKLPMPPSRMLRPALSGSVSITKIPKESKKSDTDNSDSNPAARKEESDNDTHILDSDDDEEAETVPKRDPGTQQTPKVDKPEESVPKNVSPAKLPDTIPTPVSMCSTPRTEIKDDKPIELTTDEKLPSDDALDSGVTEEKGPTLDNYKASYDDTPPMDESNLRASKINLLKNYRHQRLGNRAAESSLSQLERTASALQKQSAPIFRKNLDNITQSYSPSEERPVQKSRKKKTPVKIDISEPLPNERQPSSSAMSHTVSSMIGSAEQKSRESDGVMLNSSPLSAMGQNSASQSRLLGQNPGPMTHDPSFLPNPVGLSSKAHMGAPLGSSPGLDAGKNNPPGQAYTAIPTPEGAYSQYPPGYGVGYAGYPTAHYYGGYAAPPYYPGYPAPTPPYPAQPPAPEGYIPPNQHW